MAFEDVEAAKEVIADELKAELFGKRVAVAIKPPTFASFYKAQMALWDLAQDASKYFLLTFLLRGFFHDILLKIFSTSPSLISIQGTTRLL